MKLKPTGLAVVATALAVPLIWMVPLTAKYDTATIFSQYLGLSALITMAIVQMIATRLRFVEPIFGGLDRGYILHKWLAVGALAAVFLHDQIGAEIKALGPQSALNDLAESIGEWSYNGLIVLIIISIATFIPYHLWKWTHKLMGAFFALGAVHYMLILKPFSNFDPLGLYVGGFCVVGLLAYAYTLLPVRLRANARYTVADIKAENGVVQMELAPGSGGLSHRAGQFAFLTLDAPNMGEAHPFTISRAPNADRTLRFTVKGLGDYSNRLGAAVRAGMSVQVDGPYGRFVRRRSPKKPQIWIAAGIGITPFAAWAGEISDSDGPVHLFYCVRSRDEAVLLDELEAVAEAMPDFHLHLVSSQTEPRLDAGRIAETVGAVKGVHAYFCGPKAMRDGLRDSLADLGLPKRRFHFEEFEIRTGVGLGRLLKWLWARQATQNLAGRIGLAR